MKAFVWGKELTLRFVFDLKELDVLFLSLDMVNYHAFPLISSFCLDLKPYRHFLHQFPPPSLFVDKNSHHGNQALDPEVKSGSGHAFDQSACSISKDQL